MLREALDWLVTPSLPFARRSGHLSEFVAIAARRRRHRAAWASHEARSRAAVLRAATAADPDGEPAESDSGGDLAEFGSAPSVVGGRRARWLRDVWGLLYGMPKPTVA